MDTLQIASKTMLVVRIHKRKIYPLSFSKILHYVSFDRLLIFWESLDKIIKFTEKKQIYFFLYPKKNFGIIPGNSSYRIIFHNHCFFFFFQIVHSLAFEIILPDNDTELILEMYCRTERGVALSLEEYRRDTCARCYFYLPPFAFKDHKAKFRQWFLLLFFMLLA